MPELPKVEPEVSSVFYFLMEVRGTAREIFFNWGNISGKEQRVQKYLNISGG